MGIQTGRRGGEGKKSAPEVTEVTEVQDFCRSAPALSEHLCMVDIHVALRHLFPKQNMVAILEN